MENGRQELIDELIESINSMLDVIEKQEIVEPEFGLAVEVANQLREEIVALQE